MDRLLTLAEALRIEAFELDRDGQVGYFVECLLGGFHGLESPTSRATSITNFIRRSPRFRHVIEGERERFMQATSLDETRYRGTFGGTPHASLHRFLGESKG